MEELAEEQLKEFCRRHGLAKDGYLDETELTTVCQCIGLQVSGEIIKELFEELDGDKDGRVCLSELSQMFKGMQDKIPPSPEKHSKATTPDVANTPPRPPPERKSTNGFSNSSTNGIPVNERGAFSILDPENTGFAKVGVVLDLWNQLGIGEADGARLLSDLGFPSNSKSQAINLQDLAKAVEDETDHSKDRLPLAFQVALVTYRTEAQFLRTLCESIECERDKLKADIVDAHQRSALIAQEVDEQNARLERNSQMVLRKMEMKYNEQIQELQDRFSNEKESLQQALHLTETKLKELQEEDNKLKLQISKLHEENGALEKELHNLNNEIQTVNRVRGQLEREVSRFLGVENQLQELERKYLDSLASSEGKLKDTREEMQALRDQNDELSMQLEAVRETLKAVQASHSKQEKRFVQKKRKGSSASVGGNSPASSLILDASLMERPAGEEEEEHVPVNKMGKYYSQPAEGHRSIEDTEDCDSSLEHGIPTIITTGSGSSHNNSLEHVVTSPNTSTSITTSSTSAGTCPTLPLPIAIRLAACIGESSTDSPLLLNGSHTVLDDGEEMDSEPSLSALEERLLMGQSERECASLESEMCAVAHKQRVARHFSLGSGVDRSFRSGYPYRLTYDSMSLRTVAEKGVQYDIPRECQDGETQTEETDDNDELVIQLKGRIITLEQAMNDKEAAFEKERNELKAQCTELESSLQLLREEYEKCEDYWQDKLQEAREMYEQDKTDIDEKFQDLLLKIREYEELLLSGSGNGGNERLPPIEERASLERQVTDLEEECEVLRHKLTSVKMEQENVISGYQRSFEQKLKEECANLEQQVCMLSKKCQEYESRLSALAEEERSTVEESGMMDLMKERIKQLELQLRSQEERFKQQVGLLEATLKEREALYKKSIPEITKPLSPPQFGNPNQWNPNELISQSKSKSLLEMLHNSQKPESIWPQRYAGGAVTDKSSSLPFIPADPSSSMAAVQPGAWGSLSPPFHQPADHLHASASWAVPVPSGSPHSGGGGGGGGGMLPRKAWCHVELGWLQSLRAKLKQKDEQCYLLQRALQHKDTQTEKLVTELKYQHEMEISNWESLMQASQELLRQHVIKHKEQAEKLAHSDLLMKDLWVENAKLMAALNATEQRVIQLENLLKFQMTTTAATSNNGSSSPRSSHPHSPHLNHQNNYHNSYNQQQQQHNYHHHHQYQAYSTPSSPHNNGSPHPPHLLHNSLFINNNNHHNNNINNNNDNSLPNNAIMLPAPLSLPHQSSHFHI